MTAAVKVWDRDSIIELLATNNAAVERALLTLFARQTASEQNTERTEDHNNRGFGAFDAEIFSSFAKQIKQGRSLSPKQLAVCRKVSKRGGMRIGRYWRQLLEEVEAKGLPVNAKVPAATKSKKEMQRELDIMVRDAIHDLNESDLERVALAAKTEREIEPAWGEW